MMKRVLLLAIVAVAAAGCRPGFPSLHSLATPEQLVEDPAFVGHWRIEDEEDFDEVFFVAPGQEGPWKRVRMLADDCEDQEADGLFHAALTQIEDVLFLILTEDDSELMYSVPIFDFLRVRITTDRIELQGLDEDWLSGHLEANPEALSVVWRESLSEGIFGSEAKFKKSFVVTASTEALRDFYRQHLDTEGAFGEVLPLVRLGEEEVLRFEREREACGELLASEWEEGAEKRDPSTARGFATLRSG